VDDDATKAHLHRALRRGRESVLAKVDGLTEYDARRPLTPTGTNLLGLVKHLATWESRYLGHVMGRPYAGRSVPPWDEAEGEDTWVRADETRAEVLALFGDVTAHSDATIEALPLDAPGHVPWWAEPDVTLLSVLVHLVRETERHAGHADVVREQLDGRIGVRGTENVADDAELWAERYAEVERSARPYMAIEP
jgi:hypothetical protein